jgi:hypothetical protein
MKKVDKKQIKLDEPEETLSFIERTKSGCYTPIRESDLKYVRITEITQFIELSDDDYYYSIT